MAAECRSKDPPCSICGRRHHTMLHRSPKPGRVKRDQENDPGSTLPENEMSAEVLCSNAFSREKPEAGKKSNLLLTAMMYVEGYDGQKKMFRAILDTASQVNLMTSECANVLRLKKEKANVSVSGINGTVRTIKSKLNAIISNSENSFKDKIEFLVVSNIIDRTPSRTLGITNLELPQNVKLADKEFF
ncbi:hypothetical protein AVEN_36534-1 [Araneus ventricosus]|uniref:Peptidase aspartic putative domain-containing protein n=1 Tax=Araneus ventricosus TaxID=182803 RepID=A0A4Y2LUK9_ARAVE|nr:hypothetical protein AVEN_102890-1 [Araneus ventricosus]GBN18491.1 hypothetical protein AVEN_36534-1 [Araneus ventricosus]